MPSVPERRGGAAAALLEAAAWLLPAASFLWGYSTRTGAGGAAVLAHLQVVLALAAATVAVRWTVHLIAGRRAAAVAGALASALVLALLWLYYAVTIVGLDAWGHVVSWSLITTYAGQAGYLTDVLGPAGPVAAGAVLVLFLALVLGLHALYRRSGWMDAVLRRLGPRLAALGPVAAAVLLTAFASGFAGNPPTELREPVALTLRPDAPERRFARDPRTGGEAGRERAAYAAAHGPRPVGAGTNVILIVSDALRARNMGVYGYPRATTPYLSQLAAEGSARRILRTQSVCSLSICGLLGIATSRYLHEFGEEPLTLPEVLRMHGYQAHMVLGGDHTNFYGLRGIYGAVDSYHDGSMGGGYMNDDAHVVDALRRLQPRSARNNFIQVHLMSSHLLGRRSAPDRFGAARSYHTGLGGLPPSDEQRLQFLNFYDAGVAQADETVRRLLQVLREKGLLEDALVVVTADHGEFVGERGLFGHAKAVHGEVIDIPLVLIPFGKARPLDVDERRLASQVDIAPTVLAQLGMPVPASWSGVPLQSRAAGTARQVFFQQAAEFGLVERREDGSTWKYWVDARSGRDHAFDLDADPLETHDRAAELDAAQRSRWRRSLLLLEAHVRSSLADR